MALDCSKIKTGFTQDDCSIPEAAGTGARILIASFTDIDKALSTYDTTDPSIITSIVMKEGAQFFEVDSLPNATVGDDSLNVGTYITTHVHSTTVRIFKKSQAAKVFINDATNARVVEIVQNNATGDDGDTKYEVYGWDSGLKMSDLVASTEMADNVPYVVTFSSDDVAQERTLPKSFFVTDEATTDEAVEALLTPVVTPGP